MEVRWTDIARADIDEIHAYISTDQPAAADRIFDRILEAVESLADMPHRGRIGRWPGTRELIVPSTAYVVPYRINGQVIEILRVLHAARRWPGSP